MLWGLKRVCPGAKSIFENQFSRGQPKGSEAPSTVRSPWRCQLNPGYGCRTSPFLRKEPCEKQTDLATSKHGDTLTRRFY
jgi:hypothetical protein